jgi:hypothetical protein
LPQNAALTMSLKKRNRRCFCRFQHSLSLEGTYTLGTGLLASANHTHTHTHHMLSHGGEQLDAVLALSDNP